MLCLRSQFVAEVVRWAIRQNPYPGTLPPALDTVVMALNQQLPTWIKTDDTRAFCLQVFRAIPAVMAWNLSAVERAEGLTWDDPRRASLVCVTRYGGPAPEHDVIDIDALAMNVARCLEEDDARLRSDDPWGTAGEKAYGLRRSTG